MSFGTFGAFPAVGAGSSQFSVGSHEFSPGFDPARYQYIWDAATKQHIPIDPYVKRISHERDLVASVDSNTPFVRYNRITPEETAWKVEMIRRGLKSEADFVGEVDSFRNRCTIL